MLDDLQGARETSQGHRIPPWFHDTSAHLLDIALDIMDFTKLLNTRLTDNKLFALDYTDALLVLTSSLLQVAPVTCEIHHGRDDLVHKALLAYTVTFRPEYGRRLAKYDFLGRELRSSAQAFKPSTTADYELLLWCLFCGAIQVFGESEYEEWLSPMMARVCDRLRLRTWAETRRVLSKIAWIPSVHGPSGEALWTSIGKSSPQRSL